jgi:hypothetical protein
MKNFSSSPAADHSVRIIYRNYEELSRMAVRPCRSAKPAKSIRGAAFLQFPPVQRSSHMSAFILQIVLHVNDDGVIESGSGLDTRHHSHTDIHQDQRAESAGRCLDVSVASWQADWSDADMSLAAHRVVRRELSTGMRNIRAAPGDPGQIR